MSSHLSGVQKKIRKKVGGDCVYITATHTV